MAIAKEIEARNLGAPTKSMKRTPFLASVDRQRDNARLTQDVTESENTILKRPQTTSTRTINHIQRMHQPSKIFRYKSIFSSTQLLKKEAIEKSQRLREQNLNNTQEFNLRPKLLSQEVILNPKLIDTTQNNQKHLAVNSSSARSLIILRRNKSINNQIHDEQNPNVKIGNLLQQLTNTQEFQIEPIKNITPNANLFRSSNKRTRSIGDNIFSTPNQKSRRQFLSDQLRNRSISPRAVLISPQQNNDCTITTEQIYLLYEAKQLDNQILPHENSMCKFEELCRLKCVNRKIKLNEQSFGLNASMVIADILRANDQISQVILSRNRLGDEGIKVIAQAFRGQRNIIRLDISNNHITYRGAVSLFEAVRDNYSLVDINLASNSGPFKNIIGLRGAEACSAFLNHQGQSCLLQYLNLQACGLGNDGVIVLSKSGLRYNHSLLTLNLRGNNITNATVKNNQGISFPSAIEILVIFLPKSLIEFDISMNDIGDEGVKAICDNIYYRLEEKSIDQSPNSSDHEFRGPKKSSTFPQKPLVQTKSEKQNVQLEGLKILNVSSCNITFIGFEILLSKLRTDHDLVKLKLDDNPLSQKRPINHYYPGFIELFLIYNSTIQVLSLKHCNLDNSEAEAIGRGMLKNYTLQELKLDGNQLTNTGTKEICRALQLNRGIRLKVLDFSENKLGDEGALDLGLALKTNKSLVTLDIRDNDIQMMGGATIVESMLQNYSITTIKASGNMFYIRFIDKIWEYTERNQRLKRDLIMPQLLRDRSKLSLVASSQAVFKMLENEITKSQRKEKQRLVRIRLQHQSLIKNEEQKYSDMLKETIMLEKQLRAMDIEMDDLKERERTGPCRQLMLACKDAENNVIGMQKMVFSIQEELKTLHSQVEITKGDHKKEMDKLRKQFQEETRLNLKVQQALEKIQPGASLALRNKPISKEIEANHDPLQQDGQIELMPHLKVARINPILTARGAVHDNDNVHGHSLHTTSASLNNLNEDQPLYKRSSNSSSRRTSTLKHTPSLFGNNRRFSIITMGLPSTSRQHHQALKRAMSMTKIQLSKKQFQPQQERRSNSIAKTHRDSVFSQTINCQRPGSSTLDKQEESQYCLESISQKSPSRSQKKRKRVTKKSPQQVKLANTGKIFLQQCKND